MRNTRGAMIVAGLTNDVLDKVLVAYDRIVFTLNTLKTSNIALTRFLPPRNVNTFCAPRSRTFVGESRLEPSSWKRSVLIGPIVVAAPAEFTPPYTLPGPLTE